ncbi:hypothetical protein [Campylobacter corcagiensis]|uniref:Uncharacterized protein n=1 Tax=Campylobacter corcagiensis TaxID=1448857 RepID=A0A7M1LIE7_9BACT|nr:hypothetical protein [Campylobacter corcagiensis]QKF64550.1 hypothetical protein CCORG_0689 [Campylobacter corcagiensis]QOQ87275.1 hypothetical protein IMC76_08725 [Campylobacter corcagiensis]
MRYLDKDIWFKAPLIKPKITISNDYSLVGKNVQTKFSLTPTLRVISHNYFVHDLKELREFEAFFDKHKARLKDFFIPSHTKDLTALKSPKGNNYFSSKNSNKAFWIYAQTRHLMFNRRFITQILDVKLKENSEVVVLKDALEFDVDENTLIEELIHVRFNKDEIEFIKNNSVGFRVSLDFKEVFYE